MTEPIFWLGLSILLVAVSLTAVLVAAVPAFQELARAARSAEKLFDTLRRELPPTLEALRLTGLEISDLTDDFSEGVQRAGNVARQIDQSVEGAKQQVQTVSVTTRSVFTGVKAAWRSLSRAPDYRKPTGSRRYPPGGNRPDSGASVMPQPSRGRVARYQRFPSELDRPEPVLEANPLDDSSMPGRNTGDDPSINPD